MMPPTSFPGKLALQQRVLPTYRAPFFDALAAACTGGMSLFAGEPRPKETIAATRQLEIAQYTHARNFHILGGPLYLCWQGGLLDWLEAAGPDALVVEANPRYLTTPSAIRWMQTRGRPVLGWGLGAPPLDGLLSVPRRRARLRLLRSLDGIIAYSQRGAAEYRALGIPAEKVFVASNAAAPRPAAPPPERPPTFGERPSVLFVGRLQARKRVDNLLHACAALPGSLQPKLTIVGDGPARAELEALAETVYPPATFPGARHGDQLAPLFAQADLFALPGTGGLAVQQAMSHALPVLVAQGDGTQEDLLRPGNGWLVPPDDLPALTQTLQTALSDPARLRKMGAESYRIVAEEINLEAMAAAFVEALGSIMG